MAASSVTPRICILALAIVLGCSLAHAQSLKLGLHARAFRLLSDESSHGADGAFTRPVSEGGYGFGAWAPSVDLDIRFSPYRSIITVAGDLSYTPLKGSGTTRYIDETADPMGEREYSAQLYIASFGVQFKTSQGTIRPYMGARLQWSFLSNMTVKFPGAENQHILPRHEYDFVCFGIGIVGGAEFDLDSTWSLDVTTRYNITHVGNSGERGYSDALSIGVGVSYEIL